MLTALSAPGLYAAGVGAMSTADLLKANLANAGIMAKSVEADEKAKVSGWALAVDGDVDAEAPLSTLKVGKKRKARSAPPSEDPDPEVVRADQEARSQRPVRMRTDEPRFGVGELEERPAAHGGAGRGEDD